MAEIITNYDFFVLDFIRERLSCGLLDAVMAFFTHLGNGGIIWLFTALLLLSVKPHRKAGLILLLGLALGFLLANLTLKPLVARPRPFSLREISLLIPAPDDFSFPSGHTVSSFISAFLLLRYKKPLGLCALPVATLIAFSRLYLYVHFPTDVLFAVFLAALIFLAVSKTVTYINRKKDCSE